MALISKKERKRRELASQGDLSIRSLLDEVCDRNIGAITAMLGYISRPIIHDGQEERRTEFSMFNDLLYIRDLGVTGEHLWAMWRDVCTHSNENLDKIIHTLKLSMSCLMESFMPASCRRIPVEQVKSGRSLLVAQSSLTTVNL